MWPPNSMRIDSKDRAEKLAKLFKRYKELQCLEYEPFPYQLEAHKATEQMVFVQLGNRLGKVLHNDTLIPTMDGFKKNGELVVGDIVIGSDGLPTKVLQVYPHKDWEFYKITFTDGSYVLAGKEHKWICKPHKERFEKRSPDYGKWKVLTTEEIINIGKYAPEARRENRVAIPYTQPIYYPERELLIDPYTFGILIGDGHFGNSISVTSKDEEIINYLKNKYEVNCRTKKDIRTKSTYDIILYGMTETIRVMGLSGLRSWNKYLPFNYKMASIQQRKDLLAGLLDTDGTVCATGGTIEYYTTSEQLAKDVKQLIESLGGRANIKLKPSHYLGFDKQKVRCRDCYRVHLYTPFNPFKIERKRKRYNERSNRFKHERLIDKIEYWGKADGACIEVDNKDHSYLCTENYIVTHNSYLAVREAIFWLRGKHPYKKLTKTSGLTIWIVQETMSMASQAIYEGKIKSMLPENEYRELKEQSLLVGIEHKVTKSKLYFKAMAKGSSRVQSDTVDLVIIDEMPPDFKTFTELLMRIRGAHGHDGKSGQVYMTFTPLKLVKKIKDFITNPEAQVKTIRATAYDCPLFTKEEIDRAKKIYPEREFKVRYLGDWASYEGALVPSFTEECIVEDFHIPDKWRKILCVDPATSGYVGLAVMAESDTKNEHGDNIWYVVKEDMVANIEPSRLVDYAEEFASDYNISDRFSDIHETWFIKIAQSKGINYKGVKKLKNEEMVVELDNSFAEGSLYVFKSCESLQNQLFSYVNKEDSQKFSPVRGDYHILDAIKYGNRMKESLGEIKENPIKLNSLWSAVEAQFFSKKAKRLFSESI